jgi:DNA-binding transcriptional MerR regulator
MAFFDDFTISLKQKWLQFFQVNRSWIVRHMEVESVYTPDGGRRPPSYLILGVVNALEPQLADLMLPFSKLNPDVDALIDVLELNFDPDFVLGNRFNPVAPSGVTVPDVLIAVEAEELSDMPLAQMADEVAALTEIALDQLADELVPVASDEDPIVVLNVADPDALGGMSLSEIADAMGLEQSDDEFLETLSATQPDDALGGMSLSEIADAMGLEQSDDESLETLSATQAETPSATQPEESGNLLSDVWDEGATSESEQAQDETRLEDEKQSENDQEISRLFPNS